MGAASEAGAVKVFAFLPRRQGLSEQEFHAHWRHPHGTLAKPIDTFTGYHQAHRIELDGVAGLGSPHDGAAEMWFADLAAAGALAENRIYVETVVPDEPNFIELGPDAFRVLTRELRLGEDGFDPAQRGVKLLHCVRRRPELEPAEFAARFAAAEGERPAPPGATRRVLCLALAETYGERFVPFDGTMHRWQTAEPYDAVREIWWPDRAAVRRAAADRPAWERLLAPELVDPGRSHAFLAAEHVVLAAPPLQ